MTWTRRFVCFLFAIAATMLAAIAFLYFQIRRDIPFAFHVNLALAGLVSLVVPLGAVAARQRLAATTSAGNAYLIYYAAAAAVAIVFSLL